jgi:hypothetical protein
MLESQIKTQTALGSKEMRVSDGANEEAGLRSSSGILSWGSDQHALPGLKYTLTISGYAILP